VKARLAEASETPDSNAAARVDLYLQPGRVFVSAQAVTVRTILGSCVSVCLFDRELRAGGMNHYLLPNRIGSAATPTRFGPAALERLVAAMIEIGGRKSCMQAKVFGGARLLQPPGAAGASDLGSKNVALAFDVLAAERIPVVAHDVGGSRGRQLLFQTDDGAAFVRRL
jgi:chemotaxis protein CheD